jgi:cytochrome c553
MIQAAKAMTDEEIRTAAAYIAALKYTPWIRVVEAETVPKMRIGGNVFFAIADGWDRAARSAHRGEPRKTASGFELRDPHSGLVAYVPKGSLTRGAALARAAATRTLPCNVCHGSGPERTRSGARHRGTVRQLPGPPAVGFQTG